MRKTLLISLILMGILSHAQDCTEKLYNANKLYEQGQIEQAIALAKECTDSENETDRWKAHRLLAMIYIATDQKKEAREAVEQMKEINPTYQPSVNDPSELAKMLNGIKVEPIFSMIATTLGVNTTNPKLLTTYNGASYSKEYNADNGWFYGLVLGYSINTNVSLGLGLFMNQKNYGLKYQAGSYNIEVNEKMNYLNAPLYVRFYTNPINKFRLFADAGVFGGLLTNSQSNFSLVSESEEKKYETKNLNSIDRKRKWEYGEVFGAGITRSLNKFEIAVDLRYYVQEGRSIIDPESRYTNNNLLYDYFYLDDDLELRQLAASLSVVYNISYRVVRKKSSKL